MISRKRIFDISERLSGYLLGQLSGWAFPGRDRPLPPVLVIALPKSGSIYLQRALRRTLRVPIHHFSSGGMFGASFGEADLRRFARGNVVSREHLQPRDFSLNVLARHGVRRAVLHLRDPRAAIVSWTRHMDRVLELRGFRAVELSCELPMPEAYPEWSFDRRLQWQVENCLPGFVRWIEDWLALVERSSMVEFLVTDYEELSDDCGRLIGRILEFNGIAFEPDWISLPVRRRGANNIYSELDSLEPGDAGSPRWATAMSPGILRVANDLVPDRLIDRFRWAQV